MNWAWKNVWIAGLLLLGVNLFERLLLRALSTLASDHPELFSSIVNVVSALERRNMHAWGSRSAKDVYKDVYPKGHDSHQNIQNLTWWVMASMLVSKRGSTCYSIRIYIYSSRGLQVGQRNSVACSDLLQALCNAWWPPGSFAWAADVGKMAWDNWFTEIMLCKVKNRLSLVRRPVQVLLEFLFREPSLLDIDLNHLAFFHQDRQLVHKDVLQ